MKFSRSRWLRILVGIGAPLLALGGLFYLYRYGSPFVCVFYPGAHYFQWYMEIFWPRFTTMPFFCWLFLLSLIILLSNIFALYSERTHFLFSRQAYRLIMVLCFWSFSFGFYGIFRYFPFLFWHPERQIFLRLSGIRTVC